MSQKNVHKDFLVPFLIVLSIMLLLGCKTKESAVKRTILIDTFRTVQLETKTKPIKINYTLDLKCDSLGNVTDVNFKQTSGDNLADLRIYNNQLLARLKVAETTSKTDTIYKTKYKDVFQDKEVIKYRTPFVHWVLHFVGLIFLILWLRKILSIFA